MSKISLEEELKLIEAAKSNVQAFDEIYQMYFSKIYFYIKRRIIEVEIAEDITSEVFLGAVEAIHKFDTTKKNRFGSWLYRTAHNKIVDFFRKNAKKIDFSPDLSQIKSENKSQEDNYEQYENQKMIAEVLSGLKADYQQIITLRFFAEFEISEISEIMKIKENNVSVKLHRALKAFEKKYKRKFPKSVIFLIN